MSLLPRARDTRRQVCLVLVLLFWCTVSGAAKNRALTVGVLVDGPQQRELIPLDIVRKETSALLGSEFKVDFPAAKQLDGDWSVGGIEAAAERLLSDPEVDVILANGLVSSHVLAAKKVLKKPVIATVIADPVLQELPVDGDSSGKENLVYLADDHTVGSDLELFHSLIKFERLAILADTLFLDALPNLPSVTDDARKRLNIDIRLVPLAADVGQTLAAIPADSDAVYVPPLPRYDRDAMSRLAQGFIERGLPSFSLWGRDSLELGLLMTGTGRNVDVRRIARRVALNLQSILLGEDAGSLKVSLRQPEKLAINMRTARAIDYSPTWETREQALLLYDEDYGSQQTKLTLVEAMQTALQNNLALEIEKLARDIAYDDVDRARAGLLPQINLNSAVTAIDEDRANPVGQPQRLGRASVSGSQLIYSEDVRARFDISKLVSQAQDESLAVAVLDTLLSTSSAYLQLLLARAQELVIASNVEVTQRNLELAEERLRIGQVGRGDVLRWQSELAIDRQNLYRTEATRAQAETELKRILNLDQQQEIVVSDSGIPALIELLASKRFQRFFNNPRRLAKFREFQLAQGLNNAPELRQVDLSVQQAERDLLARKRAYYVPDVSLVAEAGADYLRGGAGASLGASGLDREQWSVGVQAALPLFEGGLRRAEAAQAGRQLSQAQLSRLDVEQRIRARIIAALQKTGGTYPAIRLSAQAALAARDNLKLITEAYSVGTRSITDLIDAQDATVQADLAEAQARYNFMLDYVGVLRSVSDFDVLLSAEALQQWYLEVDAFFQNAGGL